MFDEREVPRRIVVVVEGSENEKKDEGRSKFYVRPESPVPLDSGVIESIATRGWEAVSPIRVWDREGIRLGGVRAGVGVGDTNGKVVRLCIECSQVTEEGSLLSLIVADIEVELRILSLPFLGLLICDQFSVPSVIGMHIHLDTHFSRLVFISFKTKEQQPLKRDLYEKKMLGLVLTEVKLAKDTWYCLTLYNIVSTWVLSRKLALIV
ncbi:hypothetical protein K435DRAFT_807779 [Dendrothele bispora CBS 962.96]|uniref:Uncharacterized protein n=1 Tax=Dendrothele bispora (strain CBS 962.96) TaxID=1314807 RepID=A0A4V4HCE8_DENBC|nr:hypothetical protein K435DRAFT_807779 [Dendrothele bispora CBS 962.96]